MVTAKCRDQRCLDYRDWRDTVHVRAVESHRLVHDGQRWYLVAFDLDRRDWRSFCIG